MCGGRMPTEQATGAVPLTQFGRMCAALGHPDHCGEFAAGERAGRAQSWDAPGSAGEEAAPQRDQRLAAGQCVSRGAPIWPSTTRASRRPPPSTDDFHRRASSPARRWIDVFRLEETRRVSNDWVVRYDNRFFQLERQSGVCPGAQHRRWCAKREAGAIEIRYRDRAMRWTEITAASDGPAPSTAPAAPSSAAGPPRRAQRGSSVAPRHERSIEHERRDRAGRRTHEEAYGSCRSRGRRERAHRSLENPQTGFPRAPTGLSLYWKGTFLSR